MLKSRIGVANVQINTKIQIKMCESDFWTRETEIAMKWLLQMRYRLR